MFFFFTEHTEWLVVEMRLCRAITGISQKQLAEITGVSLQSIKRLEKKGTQPRYTTIIKLRGAFADLGVNCEIDKEGTVVRVKLDEDLAAAITIGTLKEFVSEKILSVKRLREENTPKLNEE